MTEIVNAKDVKLLCQKDNLIFDIHSEFGSPPNWQREPGFETLCQIILEQQVSLESARAHFTKLKEFVGEFTPENLLKLSDEEMRNCYISRQKAKYLRELSMAIENNALDLDEIPTLEEAEIRSKLTAIKGIGNWTVDIYLLFCLQHKDIFPIGDIAVLNSIKERYKVQTREEIFAVSENWKPYRSLGTYFMWHYYLKKRGRIAIY